MTVTLADIKGWLCRGVDKGATHLIVVCDTYDYGNFPVFVMPGEDAQEKVEENRGMNMQRVDEIYDFSMDVDAQLAEHRAWHI